MNRFKIFMLLASVVVMSACGGKKEVSVDSLSKLGDTYYSNQQVPVWVSATASDFDKMEYKWECDGGSFYGPTDVVRTVWVAPTKRGKYTVRCTVSCGRKEETRTATMNVTDFFADDFGSDSADNFGKSNVTATWGELNREMKLTVAASKSGTLSKSFSDDEFNFPFTFSGDFAWRSQFTDGKSYTMRMTFHRPEDKRTTYLKAICFQFLPTANSEDIDPATEMYVKNVKAYAQIYNVTFNRTTTVDLNTAFIEDMKFADGSYTPDSRGMRNIKMDVYSDYRVVGTAESAVDGGAPIVFCDSYALGDYVKAKSLEQVLNLNQIAFVADGECTIYLDNIHLNQIEE